MNKDGQRSNGNPAQQQGTKSADPHGHEDPRRSGNPGTNDSYRNPGRGTGQAHGSQTDRGGNVPEGSERSQSWDLGEGYSSGQNHNRGQRQSNDQGSFARSGDGQYMRGAADQNDGRQFSNQPSYGNEFGSGGQFDNGEYGGQYGTSNYRTDHLGANNQYGQTRQYGTAQQWDRSQGGSDRGQPFGGLGLRHAQFGKGPKGYTRSDDRIREDVSEKLAQTRGIDASDVEVTVTKGEVTLTGTVGDRQMKFHIEHIADNVNGVSDVVNQIRIKREGA